MHDLVKQSHEITRHQAEDQLAEALSTLHSVMDTYGKPFDGAVLALWLAAFRTAGVTVQEFQSAAGWWVLNETEYPKPADLIRWIVNGREDVHARQIRIQTAETAIRESEEAVERWRERHFDGRTPTSEEIRKIGLKSMGGEMRLIPEETTRQKWRDATPEEITAAEVRIVEMRLRLARELG